MRRLQTKLMLYILILGVVPMFFFGFYYYDMSLKATTQKFNEESQSVLEQLDNKQLVKVSRLQNMADILFDNAELCRILRETDFSAEGGNSETEKELEEIFAKLSRGERELESMILFSVNGGVYVLGEELPEKDVRKFILKYDGVGTDTGVLSWLGLQEKKVGNENDVVVAGTMLRDLSYKKDQAYIATVYLVFTNEIFSENKMSISKQKGESIFVYDSNAKLIYASENNEISNLLLEMPLSLNYDIYDSNVGSFVTTVQKDKYRVVYYTSAVTGWKLLRAVPYERYLGELKNVGLRTASGLIVMFALWYFVNHFIIKKMTLPIRKLVEAMKQVAEGNFDVELKVYSKDEFGMINAGFNAMVKQIKKLFEKTVNEEKKRREQDILMLRYQMNPHFLYNTLSAIRLTAIMDKQEKISKMLLILGRFLKNAILTAEQMLDVKSEIANIEDYISLYQLRYNNRLNVSIDAEASCYEYLIPSMICQPIIENAIMHGINDNCESKDSSKIEISITDGEEFLQISVFDNGCGMEKEKIEKIFDGTLEKEDNAIRDRLHIGIRNIHKRIKLIFGEKYGMKIESVPGEFTRVKLNLPKIKKQNFSDEEKIKEEEI